MKWKCAKVHIQKQQNLQAHYTKKLDAWICDATEEPKAAHAQTQHILLLRECAHLRGRHTQSACINCRDGGDRIENEGRDETHQAMRCFMKKNTTVAT